MSVFLLILGLLMFVGLVVVHELGHFFVARRNGIAVEEFGIGIPPRAFKKRMKSGFVFSLNWLPLGGFVKLKGEHDSDRMPGSFGAASLWAKTKVMLAGVGMNLITAFVLLTFVALIGMPTLVKNQFAVASDTKVIHEVNHKGEVAVSTVEPGGAAASAGIHSGDILVAIGGTAIHNPDTLREITKAHAGLKTDVVFRHGQQVLTKSITFGTDQQAKGFLGITAISNESGVQIRRFTWSAPLVAAGFMKQVTILTFQGLGTTLKGVGSTFAGLFTGNKLARQAGQTQATEQIAGPVAIYFILKSGAALGMQYILTIIAIISLTLAIMNVLPIPALDGGRLFVMLLFRGLKKPLTQQREERIHGTGFAVLMLLFVLITIVDIKRFH